ncbi:hypothetical protein [Stenotrophomonas muris]|uniref:hypothetical protein n=1 Tax=Stenotrophomonas muris TaxID=2963283 RepID=UPI0039C671FC
MLFSSTISDRFQRFKLWWFIQPLTVRAYCSGAALMGIALLLFRFAPKALATDVITYAASFFFAVGFLREAFLWLYPKLQPPLVKLAVTTMSVMALAAATGISRLAVNDGTGQDPSHFPTAVALLVPFAFVPIIAFTITVSSGLSAIGIIIWAAGTSPWGKTKRSDFDYLMLCSRIFAAAVVSIVAAFAIGDSPVAPSWMRSLARHTAFALDLYSDASCAVHPSDRFHRINDDIVILGRITPDGPRYVRRSCPLQAEAEAPEPPLLGPHPNL